MSVFYKECELNRKGRSGWPTKLDVKAEHHIWREACHKAVSTREIKTSFNLDVSSRTNLRSLKRFPHLVYLKKRRKPPLIVAHRQARLNWCTERLAWTKKSSVLMALMDGRTIGALEDAWSWYFVSDRVVEDL